MCYSIHRVIETFSDTFVSFNVLNYRTNIALCCSQYYAPYHIRNIIRVTENVIYHIRRCLKLDCFASTKWPPDLAWLINNCIIIFNNNSGMTIKTVYIPIILLPNILWHYFDAAFLLKPLKSTSNSLNIINLTLKNRIPFSPITFLLLYTPRTVYNYRLNCLHFSPFTLVNTTHMISPSPTYFFTRVLFTIAFTCHTAHLRSSLSTINSNLWYSE